MEWSPPRTSGTKSFFERFLRDLGKILAGLGNFVQVLGALFAEMLFFRLLDGNIADVFDLVAQLLQARLQSGDAQAPTGPCRRRGGSGPRSIGTPIMRTF